MTELLLKINQNMNGYLKGHVLTVICDDDHIPVDPFWRARLRDAETDNCCEILPEAKSSKRGQSK